MSDVARKNSRFFSHVSSTIEQHRVTSVLLAIAAVWLLYLLSVPGPEPFRPTALSGSGAAGNDLHQNTQKAFFSLESSQPLSPEEFDARAAYIVGQLKQIRDELDVDNAFIFSFSPAGDVREELVSNTFEVNRDDVTPHLYLVQDLTSFAWEHVRNAQLGVYIASGTEGYGVTLYDRQKTPIAFFGVSSLKKDDTVFITVDQEKFEEIARKLEIALAYPLEDFQKLQAE